jgi:hypothetical protein
MMKIFPKLTLALILFFSAGITSIYSQLYEWRGPGRTGIYNETGLLKKWPADGPRLMWEAGNMGDGYSSGIQGRHSGPPNGITRDL